MPFHRLLVIMLVCLVLGLAPSLHRTFSVPGHGSGTSQPDSDPSSPGFAPEPPWHLRAAGGDRIEPSPSPDRPVAVRSGFFGFSADGESRQAPSLLELVLLAAALIIVFRVIRPRRRKGPPQTRQDQGQEGYDQQPYKDLWNKLRSDKSVAADSPVTPNLEPDPSESEFIQGAKATFTRLTEAWDDRDLKDIQRFTTPEMFAVFQDKAEREPDGQRTEILLLNARLMGVRKEEGRETASVYFDALVHTGDTSRPENLRQVWEFIRSTEDESSSWLLQSLEDVEQEPLQ